MVFKTNKRKVIVAVKNKQKLGAGEEMRVAYVAESGRRLESRGKSLLSETMPISCALRRHIFWCNCFSDPTFFLRVLV